MLNWIIHCQLHQGGIDLSDRWLGSNKYLKLRFQLEIPECLDLPDSPKNWRGIKFDSRVPNCH